MRTLNCNSKYPARYIRPALRAVLPYTLKIQGGTSRGLPAKKISKLFPNLKEVTKLPSLAGLAAIAYIQKKIE